MAVGRLSLGVLSVARGSMGTKTALARVAVSRASRALALAVASGNYNVAGRVLSGIAGPFAAAHAAHGIKVNVPLLGVTTRRANNDIIVASERVTRFPRGRNARIVIAFCGGRVSFAPLNSIISALAALVRKRPSASFLFARDVASGAIVLSAERVGRALRNMPVSACRMVG